MGDAFLVTSGKGGTGKTTFVSHIGAALAEKGKGVLLIDANFGLRNLDIVLGMSESVVYDLYDVTEGLCDVEQAVIRHFHYPRLWLAAAPQDIRKMVDPIKLRDFIDSMREEFDFVILDGAPGITEAFRIASIACSKAVIVTVPTLCAMRDAEQASICLERYGIRDFSLVVNRVDTRLMRKKGALNIDDLIDGTRVRLIGVIPEDKRLNREMALGQISLLDRRIRSNAAFSNIASRLMGETKPVIKL